MIIRVIVGAAVVGLLSLATATCCLVWLNWNSKIWWSIASAAFVGLATALISIGSQLKGETNVLASPTLIGFDRNTGLPLQFPPADVDDWSGFFSRRILELAESEARPGPIDPTRPSEEYFTEGAEMIEVYTLERFFGVQSGGATFGARSDDEAFRAFVAMQAAVPSPPDSVQVTANELRQALSGNRFRKQLVASGDLPKGTVIESIATHYGRRLTIRKPYFFELQITIDPVFELPELGPATLPLVFPQGYVVQGTEEPLSCPYSIEARIEFARVSSQNEATPELKVWLNQTINRLIKTLPSAEFAPN